MTLQSHSLHNTIQEMCQSGSDVVVDSLLIVAPIVCGGSVFGLCFVIQYFVS